MKQIERNPDIDLDTQKIPSGMKLIEGKNLMTTARSRGIPFGIASKLTEISSGFRRETVGLVIRNKHVEEMNAWIEAKLNRLISSGAAMKLNKTNE